jgi:hypothetical protein
MSAAAAICAPFTLRDAVQDPKPSIIIRTQEEEKRQHERHTHREALDVLAEDFSAASLPDRTHARENPVKKCRGILQKTYLAQK